MKHLILDFDGVVNVLHYRLHLKTIRISYAQVHYDPTVVSWINALNHNPEWYIHWLTTWEDESRLFVHMGLDELPYLSSNLGGSHVEDNWKREVGTKFANDHPHDTVVWIDDDATVNTNVVTESGNILSIVCDSNIGITPQIMEYVDCL